MPIASGCSAGHAEAISGVDGTYAAHLRGDLRDHLGAWPGLRPDFAMSGFLGLMAENGTDISTAPPAPALAALIFFASAVTVPFFNALLALGEEIGWRGYLLPRLMPLGKPAAYAISGVVWALWHLPLILVGFNYPGYPVLGIFAFILLVTAIGVIENEVFLRYSNSTLLAAWVHGLFNCQRLGLWGLIFVGINPLIGGHVGAVGIVVFWIVGLIVLRVYAAQGHASGSNAASGRPSAVPG